MEKSGNKEKKRNVEEMKEMPLRWCPEPEMRCKKINCAGGKGKKKELKQMRDGDIKQQSACKNGIKMSNHALQIIDSVCLFVCNLIIHTFT